jgi:phytanoyl-CoA hydroxylase
MSRADATTVERRRAAAAESGAPCSLEGEVACYAERGYVVMPGVLSAAELDVVRAEVRDVVARSAGLTEHDDIYDLEPGHTSAAPKVRRIKEPHRVMSSVADLVRHPVIVDMLTRLLGPGVRFQTSKLNLKSAGDGAAVEWHQDWAFYPHTNDDLLAVGIMIDDVDESNGPLCVLPGSHRGPIHDHHAADGHFCGAIDPSKSGIDF